MNKVLTVILCFAFVYSCTTKTNTQETSRELSEPKVDTIYNYWRIDESVYQFDSMILDYELSLRTECLNDSSIVNEPYTRKTDGKTEVEYWIAHNYRSTLRYKSTEQDLALKITKETFSNSLPSGFLKIAHMWYNKFEGFEDNRPVFRAKVSKPDTDFQYDILYSPKTDEGELKLEILEM